MTEQNLIINGVDHAKFDLEWAKRGGVFVVLYLPTMDSLYYTIVQQRVVQIKSKNAIEVWRSDTPVIEVVTDLEKQPELIVRMATPFECEEADIEYIPPPMVWRDIDSAPEDGRIIEVADFRVVVANECPLSKHWKFWRDIPHPLNKNSMTQPPKGE